VPASPEKCGCELHPTKGELDAVETKIIKIRNKYYAHGLYEDLRELVKLAQKTR
jgi:hypothetical protein